MNLPTIIPAALAAVALAIAAAPTKIRHFLIITSVSLAILATSGWTNSGRPDFAAAVTAFYAGLVLLQLLETKNQGDTQQASIGKLIEALHKQAHAYQTAADEQAGAYRSASDHQLAELRKQHQELLQLNKDEIDARRSRLRLTEPRIEWPKHPHDDVRVLCAATKVPRLRTAASPYF